MICWLLDADDALVVDLHAIPSARWHEILVWNERECDPRQAVIVADVAAMRRRAFWARNCPETKPVQLRRVR